MAQTPVDVNAILAALASQQKPAGSTSQQPTPVPAQQFVPPGYPPQGIQQPPTPSLAGFSFPQPTSSGSVNLNSIRPVSTGSVSIDDAIAKARSMAQDRGGSRDDPRMSGRSNRRSRSRSPPRRDQFRDNYNPYRDERRDERRGDRGGAYGRDRSPSPDRGSGALSPRGGGRSSQGDFAEEFFTVKSALVGLIIGRNGENLRRVESETGAKVQFVAAKESGVTQRRYSIRGPMRAREMAKAEIFRIIEENGGNPDDARSTSQQPQSKQPSQPALREGENSRQILVPDKTVGLIIGRGGETIRDIQERSGCHVNIVGENKTQNGKRPVNLIGSDFAAKKAEDLIWEIVSSDIRIQEQQAQQQQMQNTSRGYDSFATQDDKSTEVIKVPSGAVGMIIGKGGDTIKDMQNQTGCKINVHQPSNPDYERQIDLVGSRRAIEAARRVIWDKVDAVMERDRNSGRPGRGDNSSGGASYGDRTMQSSMPLYNTSGTPQQAAQGFPAAAPQQSATSSGDADPYAPYGGYQAYAALWYAALQQQSQQQQGQGQ